MAKWFLRFTNGLLSFAVGLGLVTAVLYAGYALWDNQQIYASADNSLSEYAPSLDMVEELAEQEENAESTQTGAGDSQITSEAVENKDVQVSSNSENMEEQSSGVEQTGTFETKSAEAEPAGQTDVTDTERAATEEEDAGSETEMEQLFKKLRAVNPDIGAWITMPGTAINYPVVRGTTNIQYISTDIYGDFAIAGSIFLDSRNKEDYSDTYNLLYGHNMSEHRMFSDVNLYKEESFFNENQKGYIYFPSGAHWLQTISVIVTSASDSWMLNPQSWQEMEGEKMLELAETNAMFVSKTGMDALKKKLDAGVRPCIVALSTCSAEFTDARTILLTLMDP